MKKRVVKNYQDLGEMSPEDKRNHYKILKNRPLSPKLLKLIPEGKSVWIDNKSKKNYEGNTVIFEDHKWKGFSDAKEVFYYRDFFSPALVGVINRYIKPSSVVINHSAEFQYINPKKLTANLEFLIKSYPVKVVVAVDLLKIDFNKLKYTNQSIANQVVKNLDNKIKAHKIGLFQYIFESV